MPNVVTFDPSTLRIIEISTGGDNVLDVVEIYSEWKDWVLADSSRLGYPPAFRYIGSDPISPTQDAGTTFFITGGWRIRPAEHSHGLTINGNLFVEGGIGYPDVPTLGAFNTKVRYFVSNLISVAKLDELTLGTLVTSVGNVQTTATASVVAATLAATRAELGNKINKNRLEINYAMQCMILYDDDNVTPLLQWNLYTSGGEPVGTNYGVQTKRVPV